MIRTQKSAERFLNTHKKLFGFAGWTVKTTNKPRETKEDVVAEVDVERYEKTITVTLFKDFWTRKDQETVLIHELIHGRRSLTETRIDKKIEDIKDDEEELEVNDLTRGVMELLRRRKQ